jgi:hypothetical protein
LCAAAQDASPEGLRIDPQAPPVIALAKASIRPDHRYAATWDMQVLGEKRWRFRADFAGVILNFRDANGAVVSEEKRHSHCWQTRTWRPGWILFDAPTGAATVDVAFRIDSQEPLPGHFLIKDVAIRDTSEPPQPPAGHGVLRIQPVDRYGAPVPARIYLTDADGEAHVPDFAFTVNQGGTCFYFQDPKLNWITLPAGEYALLASKGFEYTEEETTVQLRAGEIHTATLRMQMKYDVGADGWFSGDHHTHLYRHGSSLFPMMNYADVLTIAKAEGLSHLPFMGEDKIAAEDQVVEEPGFIAMVTEELTRDFWGHICPIGVDVRPVDWGYGEAWPMNYDWIEKIDAQGGAVAYAHPYGPLRRGRVAEIVADPDSGLQSRGFPINLALGQTCTIDMLTKEDKMGEFDLKLEDYMRLLNLGFRAGVSGSTDFHLEQAREPIGGIRTYTKVDALTWPEVARAYREGNTFATNGPLVTFEVEGKGPGEILEVDRSGKVAFSLRSMCNWEVNEIQIWHNGKQLPSRTTDGMIHPAQESLDVRESGWALAIVKGPAHPRAMAEPEGKPMVDGPFAITSPVYIEVENKPMLPRPEDAVYYMTWIDAVRKAFIKETDAMAADGKPVPSEHIDTALRRLARARLEIARRGGSDLIPQGQPEGTQP